MARQLITTPKFRVSYSKVWDPKPNDNGDLVYGLTMIFEPDANLKKMKRIVKECRIAKFGDAIPRKFQDPFKDGTQYYLDNEKKNPEYKGKIVVNANSYNQAVGVCKIDKKYTDKDDPRRYPIIKDKSEFYSGCFAVASVVAFAYDKKGKKGVSFGLQNVIKIANGEPLGRSSNPVDDFGMLEDDLFEEDFDEDEDDDDDDDDDDLEF